MPDQVDWRSMEQDASPGSAVGRLLRDQRLARDLSIDQVAASLKLRKCYVEAIEQGRFDQLPGAAYIPAFLRAYANHLDLDAGKVLTAYQSSNPAPISRPVALPADFPIVERRAPIGLAMLTILLVLGAGYAVWHYLPRQQVVVSEKVPPVPDRLMASPAPTAPATEAPAAPTREANAPAAASSNPEVWPTPKQDAAPPSIPPAVAAVPPPPPAAMPAPAIGQAQAAQVPAPSVPAPAATAAAPSPAAAPQATAAPAPAEAVRPAPAPPPHQEAVVKPAVPPAVQAAPAAPPVAAVTPPAPPAAASPPMRADTRFFARTHTWIELRSATGEVLTQTLVRAGESYTVPAGISYRVISAQ